MHNMGRPECHVSLRAVWAMLSSATQL